MEEARRNFEIPVIRQREFQLYNQDRGAYMRRLYRETSGEAEKRPEINWELLLERAMWPGHRST